MQLAYHEAFDFLSKIPDPSSPYVLIFIALQDEQLWDLRKLCKLHPLIDSECESSWFNNKDSILVFEDYILVTLNDSDYETNDPECSQSIKIIKFTNSLLVFSDFDIECVDRLFRNPTDTLVNEAFQRRYKTLIHNEQIDENNSDIWFEIGEEQGCSEIDGIFSKIFEIVYNRLGIFIENMNKEAGSCVKDCQESYIEQINRIQFIKRLSTNQKNMIYLADLVTPKKKLLRKLVKCKLVTEGMKYYLKSFYSKTEVFQQRLRMTRNMLNTAEKIYSVYVDKTLTDSSNKLNIVSQYFSAISAIFLPLNLMAGYFGMNVEVIGMYDTTYNAFLSLCSTAIGVFILLFIYYRIKGWV